MTASTPPLVDVIAEALYRNDVHFPGELHPPFSELPTRVKNDYVHEARAVLAALTKAGGVEWGWEYQSIIGGDYNKRITRNWGGDRPLTREEAEAHVDAMNKNTRRPGVARLITRVTGPWTAVE